MLNTGPMVDMIIHEMTLEEKVGQLFQVGFLETEVTSEITELIEQYHIGGVIYFRRNISSLEQVTQLSNQLQEIALKKERGIPLIISTDQEGGIVTRLTGGTHLPGNMALGATNDLELAKQAGQTVARELLATGINMNLAPALDVNNNPANPIIGVRSFGEDPQQVAQFGRAFIEGMQGEDLIACGKHFPGHGDTDTDSHLDLPVIKHDLQRLQEVEFYPFKEAIKGGVDCIMAAHIYFPTIEPRAGIPATLSSAVLTDLLREELGYNGLIITDCMEMDAVVKTFGTVEGAVMTIEAGGDMVLISHTFEKQKQAIQAVLAAVRSGRISEERLDQSVRRILTLKEKRLGLKTLPVADYRQIDFARSEEVALQIAKKAVTVVKDETSLLPLTPEQKILVVEFAMGQLGLVEDEGKVSSPMVNFLTAQGLQIEHVQIAKGSTEIPDLTGIERVVVCTYSVLLNPNQTEVVKKIQATKVPLIVLAIRNPYDLESFPEVSTYLTTYDYSQANLLVASEVLAGKHIATGVLPISLQLKE